MYTVVISNDNNNIIRVNNIIIISSIININSIMILGSGISIINIININKIIKVGGYKKYYESYNPHKYQNPVYYIASEKFFLVDVKIWTRKIFRKIFKILKFFG